MSVGGREPGVVVVEEVKVADEAVEVVPVSLKHCLQAVPPGKMALHEFKL